MRLITRLVMAFAILFSIVGCREQRTKEEMLEKLSPESRRLLDPMQSTPLVVPGIESPQLFAADQLAVPNDWEVIGVIVGNEPRAYVTAKMSGMMEHVVNDVAQLPDGTTLPFTITFCDQTDCARVLTLQSPEGKTTTGIGTLGMLDGGLALRWEEKQFKQTETPPGLQEYPSERMTWGEWKIKHPDSKIYAGEKARQLLISDVPQETGDAGKQEPVDDQPTDGAP